MTPLSGYTPTPPHLPRRAPGKISVGALLVTLGLVGCGSSLPSTTSTPSKASLNRTTAVIKLASPALAGHQTIPAAYTCDGRNISPSLTWSAIPHGTAELVIYVLGAEPPRQTKASTPIKATVQWVVGGLSPKLHGIAAGKLPPGAVVGRNSTNKRSRYFLCPAKGVNERYIFLLYALPHRLAVQPGFKGGPLFNKINTSALAHGLLTSSYKRA
jgi:phosphatidylethanolamine-binding protein (PEBP) family uncharacterized protein